MKRFLVFLFTLSILTFGSNFAFADITSGLVAYYPLDGNAIDVYGNHGNEYGGVTYVDGVLGKAASFDGVNDYILSEVDDWTASEYTISLWVKAFLINQIEYTGIMNNFNNVDALLSMLVSMNDSFQIDFSQFPPLQYRIYFESNNSVNALIGPAQTIWQNITVTYDGQVVKSFLDGQLNKVVNLTPQEAGINFRDYVIGRNRSGKKYFKGDVDEVRIYNRALSETEIQALFSLEQASNDSDNDGVPDHQDICPFTPSSEVVDPNGCSANQRDADGDGFEGEKGTGADCDDNDPNSYPFAIEACGDNKDNNCDGAIDEGCGISTIIIEGEETWNDGMNGSYQYTVPDGPNRILVVAFSSSYSWWSGAMGGNASFDNAQFYLDGVPMSAEAMTYHGWNVGLASALFYFVEPPVGEVTISWNVLPDGHTGGFIAMTLFNCDTNNPIAGHSMDRNITTTANGAMLIDAVEIQLVSPPDENAAIPGPNQIKRGGTPFAGENRWSTADGYLVSSSKIVDEPGAYDMTWGGGGYVSCVAAFKPTSYNSDSDGDGLSDSDEELYGTNPLIADSDGDGFLDGEEVAAGSDPLDSNSVPNQPPSKPILFSPADNMSAVNSYDVLFEWIPSSDPEGDSIEYCITVKEESEPEDIPVYTGCDDGIFRNDTSLPLTVPLDPDKKYWWAAWAIDTNGNWSEASDWWSFTTVSKEHLKPQHLRISLGDAKVYLKWEYDYALDNVYFEVEYGQAGGPYNYQIVNDYEIVIENLEYDKRYEFTVTAFNNGDEYSSDKIYADTDEPKKIIVRNSPILFIPGTGGGAWDGMKSHLEDFGLIFGGELELEYCESCDGGYYAKFDTVLPHGGDFYVSNYNEVKNQNGEIIFHPCGDLHDNYLPTKKIVDTIRTHEDYWIGSKRKITLAGQSLGGLRARTYIQKLEILRDDNDKNVVDKIERLITVGTPNNGVLSDHITYESEGLQGVWQIILGNASYDADDFWAWWHSCRCSITDYPNTNYAFNGGYINDAIRYRDILGDTRDSINCVTGICNDQNKVRGFMEYLRDGVFLGLFSGKWRFDFEALKNDVIEKSNFLNDINIHFTNYDSIPNDITFKSLVYSNPGNTIFPVPNVGPVEAEFMNFFLFGDESVGDGFIHKESQSSIAIFGNNNNDIKRFGKTHLSEREDYIGLFEALDIPVLTVTVKCPVELSVESPSGDVQSKDYAGILGATYNELDIDGNGSIDKYIEIPLPEQGDYKITVIPEDGADPEETYSLEIEKDGIITVIKEDTPISQISETPEVVTVNSIPLANAGSDQTLEVGTGCIVPVTLNGFSSEDVDGGSLTYSWTWDSGSADGITPIIELPVGVHTITLVVNDGIDDSEPDDVIITVQDTTPPEIQIDMPQPNHALQDGVTFLGTAIDVCEIESVQLSIHEKNNDSSIGYDDLNAALNGDTWTYPEFDTTQLQDGYYALHVHAIDVNGNKSSEVVSFSIHNWAVLELLPSTENNKAGRTMPVKFSLRIVPEVDPTQPFVVNNELEIRIYNENTGEMTTSTYGDESANYRIDLEGEIYITNYKTDKILAKYRVEIWRPSNGFKIGEFGFETVK